ncbi:hypothetical protein EMMF5_004088 [Cystobasidiomycetes sp. EMM_F5]
MSLMQGITYGKPEPFVIPDYDYGPVQAAVKAVDLSKYYDNLLEDAWTRDDDDFTYGIPPSVTKRLIERAANGFEWPVWRKKIQDMGEHYKLKVAGLPEQGEIGVHFIHRKSDNPKAVPLLLVHGWPGSILEFCEISKILSKNYHIVMPSIPGYAFSDAPKRGTKTTNGVPWSMLVYYEKSAICFNAIMQSLGYKKYLTQGGDWGSMLTRYTAQSFPDNVMALHLNYFSAVTSKPDGTGELTDVEKRGLERMKAFRAKGSAYQEMQGTVPYTLGGALASSPVALLIYIGEKMYRWSSPHTHPSEDEVIANCMLYWFTGNITSSFWLYYFRRSPDDAEKEQNRRIEETNFVQPLAFGCGKYEIHWPVKQAFVEQIPKLRQWQQLDRGGHFLALEAPQVLARDIDEFFQTEEIQQLFD